MPTRTSASVPSRRSGMTLIEVIIAVVILSGVLIGLSNFTRRFQRLTMNGREHR
ncbi:MAG: prepilin-type N-terminal cleavage/methylation domain-containing protein [Gemmatimonadetes bacterium]|nr:prepilin-type N-terminal cleavage/methylation domain-containing protein [Gemmatimonadota bacterium]